MAGFSGGSKSDKKERSVKQLAAALVKAQAEMTGAKKDSNNPFFNSKYADLSSVDAAIGPALQKHGLAYVQISHVFERAAGIETVIVHESGETMSCGVVSVPVSKVDAQGYGSAVTYARRYSLAAAFGVCPEDDDGNAAAKAPPKSAKTKPASFVEWNGIGPSFQARLLNAREEMTAFVAAEKYDAAASVFDNQKDVTDDDGLVLFEENAKLALWSCFDSEERREMKKHSKYLKGQNEQVPQ